MQIKLKINSPHIVHDSIDGETILINLKNGNYYSFDKLGAVIWELIEKNISLNKLSEIMTKILPEAGKKVEADMDTFVQNLLKENLLMEDRDSRSALLNTDDQFTEILVKERIAVYEPPVLNKYTDMQDLLLLDPIYETDEKGWPYGN